MITERTLRKWRKEALEIRQYSYDQLRNLRIDNDRVLSERILRLTQELLDQHLLRK